MKRRLPVALLGALSLVTQPFAASPASAASNAQLKAMIEGRRWFMPQFRFNDQNAKDVPALLRQLAALPYARDHAILDPMIDIFQLAKAGQYQSIPDSAWAPVDAMLEQARQDGFTRIMPTLSFKIDPGDPYLSQYCAQWETPGPDGQTKTVPAIANKSCLPQYANPDYQALARNIVAQAIRHLEAKFGGIMVAYEPVGGVASEIDWKGTNDDKLAVFGDASPSMTARFQQHATVASSRRAFGGAFGAIRRPALTGTGGTLGGNGAFAGPLGASYAQARADVIQQFYQSIHDVVQATAPNKLFSLRMGAIIDPSSLLRGTVFFQQYAQAIRPDIMVSDASTFNHLYEGPLVAATRFQPDARGRAVPIPGRPVWASFVDRFSTYAVKGKDYRENATQQVDDCLNRADFRIIGFFVNPTEMQKNPDYLAYLQSLSPYFDPPPAPFTPQRFVQLPLGWVVDQLGSGNYAKAVLPQIRRMTGNLTVPTVIQLTQDSR